MAQSQPPSSKPTFYIHIPRLLHYGYASYTGGISIHEIRSTIQSLHELSDGRLGVSSTICHNESQVASAFDRAIDWYDWLRANKIPTYYFVLNSETIDKPRQYSLEDHYRAVHNGVNRIGNMNNGTLFLAYDLAGKEVSPVVNNPVGRVKHFERIEYKTGKYPVLVYGCEAVSAAAERGYIDFVLQHQVSNHIVRLNVNLSRSTRLNTLDGVWLYDTSDFFARLNHWLIK